MAKDDRKRLVDELKRAISQAGECSHAPNFPPSRSKRASSEQHPTLAKRRSMIARSTPCAGVASVGRSISFSPALWASVLAGRKTQTRRPVRPAPIAVTGGVPFREEGIVITPPYVAGERAWVREKWARIGRGDESKIIYESDTPSANARWIASRFMPKSAARRFLIIEAVRVERLSEISDADCAAEGIFGTSDVRRAFQTLWDTFYGESEFAVRNDPWVWAIRFALETVPSDLSSR